MRLLVYLVFGIIVLVLMGYAAPWLYRRPTVKRQQLRDVIAHRDAYKMQVIEDERPSATFASTLLRWEFSTALSR